MSTFVLVSPNYFLSMCKTKTREILKEELKECLYVTKFSPSPKFRLILFCIRVCNPFSPINRQDNRLKLLVGIPGWILLRVNVPSHFPWQLFIRWWKRLNVNCRERLWPIWYSLSQCSHQVALSSVTTTSLKLQPMRRWLT